MITEKRKQRILSELQPIAPQWAEILEKQDGNAYLVVPNSDLNIHSPSHCIVGEAHGFDGMYNLDIDNEFCNTCHRAATNVVSVTIPRNTQLLNAVTKQVQYDKAWIDLDRFVKHFTKVHKKK